MSLNLHIQHDCLRHCHLERCGGWDGFDLEWCKCKGMEEGMEEMGDLSINDRGSSMLLEF